MKYEVVAIYSIASSSSCTIDFATRKMELNHESVKWHLSCSDTIPLLVQYPFQQHQQQLQQQHTIKKHKSSFIHNNHDILDRIGR